MSGPLTIRYEYEADSESAMMVDEAETNSQAGYEVEEPPEYAQGALVLAGDSDAHSRTQTQSDEAAILPVHSTPPVPGSTQ